ncbi:MAG: hypothetical protein GY847_19945 [Proteobacteria bacterium]|nr:hypothetical protein [Pseudomonadota bacterium]
MMWDYSARGSGDKGFRKPATPLDPTPPFGQALPDTTRAFMENFEKLTMTQTDTDLIAILSQTGEDLPLEVAEEIVSCGERMVEPLCKVLLDERFVGDSLDDYDEDDPESWAPDHALILLGCIGSPKATPSILDWFRLEPRTDAITEFGGVVFGKLGPEAIDPVWDYVRDSKYDALIRSVASQGLIGIGYHHPDERPRIAREVVRFLQNLDIESAPEDASYFFDDFSTIDNADVVQAIDEIFDRNIFNPGHISRESVERDRRNHPPWWTHGIDFDLMALFLDEPHTDYSKARALANFARLMHLKNTTTAEKRDKKKKKSKRKTAKRSKKKNRR